MLSKFFGSGYFKDTQTAQPFHSLPGIMGDSKLWLILGIRPSVRAVCFLLKGNQRQELGVHAVSP